ncbi:MAG: hypothetical protein ACQKBV_05250 [Puniceicoccales bacterium]
MSFQELQSEIANLSPDERKKMAAYIVSLRHRDIDGYRARMSQKIQDNDPKNWISLEEFDSADR